MTPRSRSPPSGTRMPTSAWEPGATLHGHRTGHIGHSKVTEPSAKLGRRPCPRLLAACFPPRPSRSCPQKVGDSTQESLHHRYHLPSPDSRQMGVSSRGPDNGRHHKEEAHMHSCTRPDPTPRHSSKCRQGAPFSRVPAALRLSPGTEEPRETPVLQVFGP